MSDQSFDVVIIGGGPGGYVAAIRAAQNGLSVACVEMRGALGGTCLNVGCIPSKALLHSSHLFAEANEHMEGHGIKTGKVSIDVEAMMGRKSKIVSDLTGGIEFLFKKNKVTYVKGRGVIKSQGVVEATLEDGSTQTLNTKSIIIATGSEVTPLPGVEIDEEKIVSSTGALALPKVPKKMVVIGAGVIGLELGSVWRRLGAEVTVVEFLDVILPPMDGEVRKTMQKILTKQGMEFKLGTKVTGAKTAKSGVTLTLEPAAGGDAEEFKADVVLVAIGRRPYTEGLGLENVGIALDEKGFVPTNGHFGTAAEGVYAIGDVIGGQMLAHKAEDEGVALADMLAGKVGHVNYDAIPGVVYTHPEVASVGKTQEELKEAGVPFSVGKFPMSANSRARCISESDGFVKVLVHKETDQILGGHIIAPGAGDLIAEVTLGMDYSAASEDLALSCHAHPGLGEAVKEACLAAFSKPIHM